MKAYTYIEEGGFGFVEKVEPRIVDTYLRKQTTKPHQSRHLSRLKVGIPHKNVVLFGYSLIKV
ncbi:MAG: hypothetical protein LIO65_03305 [Odoribacter sp.]|nr:hypothetical protein [Odoribacter sp.]